MIKKDLLKYILLVFVFCVLNIPFTRASLIDSEKAVGNTFSASTLFFSLRDTGNVVLSSPLFNVTGIVPDGSETKSVRVQKDGILDFQYQIKATQTGGDSILCNNLNLEAKLDGVTHYNGSLTGFNLNPAAAISGGIDDWEFIVSLQSTTSDLKSKSCSFDIAYTGWQLDSDGTWGFVNEQVLDNSVSTGNWATAANIVINEILPDPVGDDNATAPDGEWIELYNKSDSPVSVAGWNLTDVIGTVILVTADRTDTGGTDIAGHGFLVVYMNSAILNNTGDTVNLYNGEVNPTNLIDSHTFGATTKDKSIARIPDGWGDWYDPIPTPGGPNKLSLSEEAQNQTGVFEGSIQLADKTDETASKGIEANEETPEGTIEETPTPVGETAEGVVEEVSEEILEEKEDHGKQEEQIAEEPANDEVKEISEDLVGVDEEIAEEVAKEISEEEENQEEQIVEGPAAIEPEEPIVVDESGQEEASNGESTTVEISPETPEAVNE